MDEPQAALRLSGALGLTSVERVLPAASLDRKLRSRIADIVVATSRRSFVVAFETLPELWEVSFDPEAAPVYDGMIHDWRMVEAIGVPGFLHPRRFPLPPETFPPIHRLSKPNGGWVLALAKARAQARNHEGSERIACSHVALLHLDARRIVAQWQFAGVADVATARVLLKDAEADADASALFALTIRRDDGTEVVRTMAPPRGAVSVTSERGCE